jgi:hypothetical protein
MSRSSAICSSISSARDVPPAISSPALFSAATYPVFASSLTPMRKLLLLVSICSIPACAESIFSVGILGGAPFTDVVNHTNQHGFRV